MGKDQIESIGDEIEKWLSPEVDSLLPLSKVPLLSLNHVSFVCSSLEKSTRFYADVLGFVMTKRPSSFDFQGAWLFSNGIEIHLLESEKATDSKKSKINSKDNHISFQCTDMELIKRKLKQNDLEYVTAVVEEGGIIVDQLFFHDPDGYMVEIRNDPIPIPKQSVTAVVEDEAMAANCLMMLARSGSDGGFGVVADDSGKIGRKRKSNASTEAG
ncbi:unnamed protein product [Rhodiola kirilowii]